MNSLALVATLAALLVGGVRWLRVAQREHYLRGRCTAICLMWLKAAPVAFLGWVVLAGALIVMFALGADNSSDLWPAAYLVLALAVVPPLGLSWRGRERTLVWTARVKRLAAVYVALVLVLASLASALDATVGLVVAALVVVATPAVMDAALAVAGPLEARLAQRFVEMARERIRKVDPLTVGITGSFGKTTTKTTLVHLLSGGQHVVYGTPGSFNNMLGLSRAINEGLTPGTDVFVAEMGTYGRGEIRRLVESFPVTIACITAIGDVHLERMKSRAEILTAKREITVGARAVVLCVDYPELAGLTEELRAEGQRVVTCSGEGRSADVVVTGNDEGGWTVAHGGEELVTPIPDSRIPAQVAALAIALGLELGEELHHLVGRLATVPPTTHRADISAEPGHPTVVDDTFNSNATGARSALEKARTLSAAQGGSVWVVTPGMVELGNEQAVQNEELARVVVDGGSQLAIVGRTNRRALLAGAPGAATFSSRREAAEWVYSQASERDVILFENDLPDHYP